MLIRVLLQYCAECGDDYPATEFRRSEIVYIPGVSGWICPKGHEERHCDEWRLHTWVDDYPGEVSQHCTRCSDVRIHTVAIYTTFLEPEVRPTLRNHVNVYAVVDDVTEHVMAYCLNSNDAEFVKAALVYGAEHMQAFYRDLVERTRRGE